MTIEDQPFVRLGWQQPANGGLRIAELPGRRLARAAGRSLDFGALGADFGHGVQIKQVAVLTICPG